MDGLDLLRKLRTAKIFTVVELAGWLTCSIPTVRRRLKAWGAYTSYNCNGRYYALPDVPKFDGNGLWRYRGAFFSRHGNLRRTVSRLVSASPAGLTAGELGKILGLEARSFLSHFRSAPELVRKRYGRGYVWFSGDDALRNRQEEARERMRNGLSVLSDSEAVAVLVELVKHPGSTCAELSRRLEPRLPGVTPAAIRYLLERHGLQKKRGPGSPWPER